jgi:hypothetical protein
MRIGCKACVKVKLDPKLGCWYYDAIDLYHNHQLHPEKRMTHFMRSHKNMEDGIKKPDGDDDKGWGAAPRSNERYVRVVWRA